MQYHLRTIFTTFILLGLTTILTAQISFDITPQQLIPIPVQAHHRPIKVFHIGEQPDKKHYRIALLEADRKADEPYAKIIEDLKKQGQQNGVDAIVIFELRTAMRSFVDSDGYLNNYPVKEGLAYGIKYELDLSYVHQVPKKQEIHQVIDSTETALTTIHYNMNGKITERNGSNQLINFLNEYSLQHLVYQQTLWKSFYYKNKVIKRTYANNSKVCEFGYDTTGRLEEIKIVYFNNTQFDAFGDVVTSKRHHKILLTYNEQHQIIQKDIIQDMNNESTFYREIFEYDDLGRIHKKQLFQYKNDKKMLVARVIFSAYYTEADFRAAYLN